MRRQWSRYHNDDQIDTLQPSTFDIINLGNIVTEWVPLIDIKKKSEKHRKVLGIKRRLYIDLASITPNKN